MRFDIPLAFYDHLLAIFFRLMQSKVSDQLDTFINVKVGVYFRFVFSFFFYILIINNTQLIGMVETKKGSGLRGINPGDGQIEAILRVN